jgi:hypothetical protein
MIDNCEAVSIGMLEVEEEWGSKDLKRPI